jgi:diaminohydroxyphosphoribosylaminopyrimidine deaminase/5-amino-6-(5-phosphoribosylamino)uracil reductase
MRVAIEEAELARGATGDNPWVGCAIVSPEGELLGRGHTLGPGEDHAEIAAARDAQARGYSVVGAMLYSTLEPCSFHGRTPACSKAIGERGIARAVLGMRDPHPRVDGTGVRILRDAGVEVVEGVCEGEVRLQLGAWVLAYHPHEVLRRARAMPDDERVARLAAMYGVSPPVVEALLGGPLAGAMTVNERVVAAGLVDAFDEAARRRDRQQLVALLVQAALPRDAAEETVAALLASPAKYGY